MAWELAERYECGTCVGPSIAIWDDVVVQSTDTRYRDVLLCCTYSTECDYDVPAVR